MSSLFTVKSSFISPCIINQQAFFLKFSTQSAERTTCVLASECFVTALSAHIVPKQSS